MEPLEDAFSIEDRPRGAPSGRAADGTGSAHDRGVGAEETRTGSTGADGATQTPWDREAT